MDFERKDESLIKFILKSTFSFFKKESSFGMMNLQNSQFSPLPGASPPFPAYLYPLSKKSMEDDANKKTYKDEKNEKKADKVIIEISN